ncbi:hypothetical protein HHK36_005652 [Tetracentron sinense]|uniref:Uncharacterized protein n=1 Tax=Tetracentron sinense TaxID=13715 RepID=A0A834ZKZ8_TETSI|nr:hypothetical protein HHK36_005652 [Tetracentron sinense]
MMQNNGAEATDDVSSEASTGGVVLKKGPWTAVEDAILMEYVKKNGEGNWNAVQKNSGLSRCGKSCRLRWANHLRPNLKKGSFSPDEERLILDLHSKLGNKWARMAAQRRHRAGLPLYPHNIQKQAAAFHPHQHQHYHPRPSATATPSPPSTQQPNPNYGSHLSLFDPINFSTSNPLLSHQNTPFRSNPIQRFKRFQDNSTGFSLPFSPSPTPHPSSLLSQTLSTQSPRAPSLQFNFGNFDFSPQQLLRTPFEPDGLVPPGSAFSTKLELPSNQLSQPAATAAAAAGTFNDYKITPPSSRSNSGLLDDLFQETQAMVGGGDSRREGITSQEEKWVLDGLFTDAPPPPLGSVFSQSSTTPPLGSASQWDDSSSIHSSIGVKTEKEPLEEINLLDDDLSSLLNNIPSTMSVPNWYSNNGETSNGQLSGIKDDNMELETGQLAPSLSVTATNTDHDWTLGSCSWNNMPGIC